MVIGSVDYDPQPGSLQSHLRSIVARAWRSELYKVDTCFPFQSTVEYTCSRRSVGLEDEKGFVCFRKRKEKKKHIRKGEGERQTGQTDTMNSQSKRQTQSQ